MSRLSASSALHQDRTAASSHQRRSQRNLQKPPVSLVVTESTRASTKGQMRENKSRKLRSGESAARGLRATRLRAQEDREPNPAKQQPSSDRNGAPDQRSGRLRSGIRNKKQHLPFGDVTVPTHNDDTRSIVNQHLAGFVNEGLDSRASPVSGKLRSRKARRVPASSTPTTPVQVSGGVRQPEHASSDYTPEATQPDEQESPLPSPDVLSQYDLLGHTDEIIRADHGARKSIRVAKASRSKLMNPDMKILVKRCKTCTSTFSKRDPSSESSGRQEVVDIVSQVRRIYTGRSDCDALIDGGSYRSDLYLHLIPHLVKLLREVVLYYSVRSDDLNAGLCISIEQLRLVSEVTFAIVQVLRFAKNIKKAPPILPRGIIESTKKEIATPLRAANTVFLAYLQRHRDELRQQSQNAAIEERSRHWSAIQEPLRQWRRLHEERRYAEGDYLTAGKQMHLAYLGPHAPELDSDGLVFERVHVFGSGRPHIGPSVVQLQRAREVNGEWSSDQLGALQRGLKNFTGPNVFRNIFQTYCGRGGLLNKFNVTEIVTQAAQLKDSLLEGYRDSATAAPEWVQQIPVWTRPVAAGKENETQGHRGET